MLLDDADGSNWLTIQVTGYQFPDAPDEAQLRQAATQWDAERAPFPDGLRRTG